MYGPPQEAGSLEEAFRQFVRPPFFPVTVEELYGHIALHDVLDADIEIDGAKVRVRPVPHVGANNGYRVEIGGAAVAYLADHQMPHDGSHRVTDAVLELCDGADLVIHDAQYTPDEFTQKYYWGHCTVDYAVFVAQEAGPSAWRCSTTIRRTTTPPSTCFWPTPATSPRARRCPRSSPRTRASPSRSAAEPSGPPGYRVVWAH